MDFWGARAASFAVPLGLGLLLGLTGPSAEYGGGRPGAAVGAVFTGGWPWACYAFLVGYFRRSKIESVVLAPLGLAVGVVTYCLTKGSLASLDGMDSSGAGSSGIALRGVLAFLFGAPLGLLGNLARVPGIGGLFFRLLVPVVAFTRPPCVWRGSRAGRVRLFRVPGPPFGSRLLPLRSLWWATRSGVGGGLAVCVSPGRALAAGSSSISTVVRALSRWPTGLG